MKKILAIALAAMMLIGCAVFASAAETTLADMDCTNWWTHAHSILVDEAGVEITYTSTTNEAATEWFHGPSYVLFSEDNATVNGPTYAEYWINRADNWGWTLGGAPSYYATGTEINSNLGNADNVANMAAAGISWSSTFAEGFNWDEWLPGLKAGVEVTITAQRAGDTVTVVMSCNGITSTATLPVDPNREVYLSLTGEQCKFSNIVVSTPDPVVEAPIADGDTVRIYFPKNETYISATANDTGKKLLEGNEGEAAVFSVEVDENGYYTFVCNGKYLTSGATGNSLTLADAASEYSLWTLEAAENGWFIKNVNAAYNGAAQYLEFYSGFTTYGKKDTADVTLYTYQFVKVQAEGGDPIAPDTGDGIFAVLTVMGITAMGLTAVVSKKR